MARPIRHWFRFYVEAFSDRKIRRLKPAQRWVWVAILGAARDSYDPGVLYVAPDLPMTEQELADFADVPLKEVSAALRAMESMSMVTRVDGTIQVTNWDVRQFESDNVTARTRNHRERSRERSNDVPGNGPETETETETETEQETTSLVSADKPRAKKATQRPADFRPTAAHVSLATERSVDLTHEWAKFCDWTDANGKTYKDWSAALRNWIRNARPSQQSVTQSRTQQHLRVAEKLQAEQDAQMIPFPQTGGGER